MRTFALVAAIALGACGHATVPAPSRAAPRIELPLHFELVTEKATAPNSRGWTLMALSSGAVLVENRTDGWSASVAAGKGPFRALDALRGTPATGGSWNAAPAGEVSGKLWFSASFYDGANGDHRDAVIEVIGPRATTTPDLRAERVLPTPGGGAMMIALHGTKQTFEAVDGSRAIPPVIPPGVHVIDADLTPDGEVHALGARNDDPRALVGLVAPPGGKTRMFPLPWGGDYDSSRAIVHGHPSFLYVAGWGQTIMAERDGRAVEIIGMPRLFQYAATPTGDIFYVTSEEAIPVPKSAIGYTRVDDPTRTYPTSPLLDAAGLAGAGGAVCTRIQSVKQLVVSGDGTVWLNVYCSADAMAVLRSTR